KPVAINRSASSATPTGTCSPGFSGLKVSEPRSPGLATTIDGASSDMRVPQEWHQCSRSCLLRKDDRSGAFPDRADFRKRGERQRISPDDVPAKTASPVRDSD